MQDSNQPFLALKEDQADWDAIREKTILVGHHPARILVPALSYLIFSSWLGPLIMSRMKPFELKLPMRLFNIYSVVLNIVMINWSLTLVDNGLSFFTCDALRRDPITFAKVVDIFLCSRLIDFIDTIFFVLRKKTRQISRLHVIHHFIVPVGIWWGCHYTMTPFWGLPLFINAWVHLFMYSYYFLSTFPFMRKHLWWKNYITLMQIVQFVLDVIYLVIGYAILPGACGEKPNPLLLSPLLAGIVWFGYQFTSFYSKNFTQPKGAKEAKKST